MDVRCGLRTLVGNDVVEGFVINFLANGWWLGRLTEYAKHGET